MSAGPGSCAAAAPGATNAGSGMSASGRLRAAADPRRRPGTERLLVVSTAGDRPAIRDARVRDLGRHLTAGDLLVVNDAATLPASLPAVEPAGIEIRLLAHLGGAAFRAVVFGAGDFRTDTDARPPPPVLETGVPIVFTAALTARVAARHALSPRLIDLVFDREGPPLLAALYRAGAPVQYAYLSDALPLSAVQTVLAGPAWSVEMPSAARPLTWRLLLGLRARGVELASLTHAAGLSATGDRALDAALPLPERYAIPAATVDAVERARARGGRVIAVGTTVVRALEGSHAAAGRLRAGEGVTDLRIDGAHRRRVCDALLTNMHGPGESHFAVVAAFAGTALLRAAHRHAVRAGYLAHELGDAMLVT